MSRLQHRSSIALAAVVAVLLLSRPADAQVFVQGPHRQHGGLLNNAGLWSWTERVNLAAAERRLPHAQEKLNRDAARNDGFAVNRDVRTIDNLHYRIAVDEWLIIKMSGQDPGFYALPRNYDPMTYCTIAQYHTPQRPVGTR